MSFEQTKVALLDALELPNTSVIALHGLWGTGKTHLWREVALELEQKGKISHLYVSCMAYGSIASLRAAVIAMLLSRTPGLAKHGEKIFKVTIGILNKKLLPKELQLSTNLSDFQAFLPQLRSILPKNTLLVFDDIERAAALNIRELLGFVSFLVEQLGVRILLIANKEKLGNRHRAWEQMREKIINIEIALQPRPDDCVRIGLGEIPSERFSILAERVRQLGITNIRTLQHMRRTYEAFASIQQLDETQWSQLLPSIALFVSLHFNAIDDAPTIKQALSPFASFGVDPKKLTKKQRKAQQLLKDYGLGSADDFETELLLPYLQTGFLNKQAFVEYVTTLQQRQQRQEAEAAVDSFLVHYYWDATQAREDFIDSLENLRPRAALVDESRIAKLSKLATELNAPDLANSLVREWLDAHRESISKMKMDESYFDLQIDSVKLPADILAAYRARYDALFPPMSLLKAIDHIRRHGGWGDRQSRAIDSATDAEIESLIRTCDPESRGRLFRFFADYLSGRIQGGTFPPIARRFAKICRDIVAKEPESRIATIIKRAFKDMDIPAALSEPRVDSESSEA